MNEVKVTIRGSVVQEWVNGKLVREHFYPEAKTMAQLKQCARELQAELRRRTA